MYIFKYKSKRVNKMDQVLTFVREFDSDEIPNEWWVIDEPSKNIIYNDVYQNRVIKYFETKPDEYDENDINMYKIDVLIFNIGDTRFVHFPSTLEHGIYGYIGWVVDPETEYKYIKTLN